MADSLASSGTGTGFLDPIDPIALSGQLEPRQKGRDAGDLGRPAIDATSDPDELELTREMERRVRRAADRFGELRRQALRDLEETERSGRYGPADIHEARQDALAVVQTIRQTRQSGIHSARQKRQKQLEDLARFKKDNRIRREPSYPPRRTKVLMYLVAAFLVLVETVLNGAFLSVGAEGGLLEGAGIALGISLVNVVVPLIFFGPVSRHLAHVRPLKKIAAGALTGVYVVVIFVLNLGVAHYREASAELTTDIGLRVMDRLQTDPFVLADAQSWLIFVLGLMFSAIGFVEGRRMDDVYPGFGKIHREAESAKERYEDEVEEVSQELNEARARALERIKRIVYDLKEAPRKQLSLSRRMEQWITEFDAHVAALDKAGRHMVREYREANLEARLDATMPACHRATWRLSVPEIDRSLPDLPGMPADSREMDDTYRQAADEITQGYEAVRIELFEPGKARVESPSDRKEPDVELIAEVPETRQLSGG